MTKQNQMKQDLPSPLSPLAIERRRNLSWQKPVMVTLSLMFMVTALASCGKKPGSVDPPPNLQEDKFPQFYPDPATDPKP